MSTKVSVARSQASENPQDAMSDHDSHAEETVNGKKRVCCSERFKPFFPLEKMEPTQSLRARGPGKTIYQRDYPKHPLGANKDMKNDLWTTFHTDAPMDFGTTMRNDFKKHPLTKPQTSMGPRPVTSHVPFNGKSLYKREYVDWKGNHAEMTLPVRPSTVVSSLPFLNRTTYRENYIKPEKGDELGDELRNANKNKLGSPFSPAVPFLGETSYQKSFKPFRVGSNSDGNGRQQGVTKESPYPGQYQTTNRADFSNPKTRYHCPYRDE